MEMIISTEDQEAIDDAVLHRMETFGETPAEAIAAVLAEFDDEEEE